MHAAAGGLHLESRHEHVHVPLNVPLARAAFERTERDGRTETLTFHLAPIISLSSDGFVRRYATSTRVGLEFKTTEAAKGTKTESPCPRSHAS